VNSFKRTFGFINNHPLAGRHLFTAYLKFLKWQLRSRLSTKIQTVAWLGGLKVQAQKGSTGITGNIYTGLHEFEDMGFLLHFLNQDDIFFDIGANVGSYTLLAAGLNKATCISFEPAPETFEKLTANVRLNNLSNRVTCLQTALGADPGTIDFTQDGDTTNHVVKNGENINNAIKVPVQKLDDLSYGIPSLIKIDVEGFETEVIKGAQTLLRQRELKAIIIELNGSGGRYNYDDHAIHRELRSLGFDPFGYEPFARKLTPLRNFGNFNTIYIRDIDRVKERLRTAPAFMVFGEQI
jgi:FkbM family methyltransferase